MDVQISGNPLGRTVVLLGGWPDTSDVFSAVVAPRLAADYRLVGLTLPGFAAGPISKPLPFLGYSFAQLVDMLHIALEDAMSGDASHTRPMLICHDWGCTVSYEFLLLYPHYFSRIVALDVASHPFGEGGRWTVASILLGRYSSCSFKKFSMIACYQWFLIAAYFAPRAIGDRMAAFYARISGWPKYRTKGAQAAVRGNMGYPYVQLWIGLLTRRPLITHKFLIPINVPILYMYGTSKPFQFHSGAFLEHVKSKAADGSKVVPVKGGHWFYARSSTSAAHTADEIVRFLAL
jgi:pimeloyl-ACP methyl ester carboxylesterase